MPFWFGYIDEWVRGAHPFDSRFPGWLGLDWCGNPVTWCGDGTVFNGDTGAFLEAPKY